MPRLKWPDKRPGEVLDYTIKWSARLDEGETISVSQWLLPDGLVKTDETVSGAITTVWLNGGAQGATYLVVNKIKTNKARTMEQVVELTIDATG